MTNVVETTYDRMISPFNPRGAPQVSPKWPPANPDAKIIQDKAFASVELGRQSAFHPAWTGATSRFLHSGKSVPMTSRSDVVARIRRFNAGLDPERLALKYQAMQKDAFAFFRGTCHLFYDRLPPLGRLMKAPAAWCCGDLHLENFGSFKGDNGLVYFDLNDFDEALLAPCVWDLIRLVASISVARKFLGITRHETTRLGAELVDAYAEALASGKPRWVERDTAGGVIGTVLSELRGRSRKEFLERRTVRRHGRTGIRIDRVHALPVCDRDRKFVVRLIDDAGRREERELGKPIDVARRIAGCGSLGLFRYVILTGGKREGHQHLLDLKEARASSSVKHAGLKQPKWASEAERVIAIQERCQAVSPAFLTAIKSHGCSFVLRALQPVEDRLDLAHIAGEPGGLAAVFRVMGSLSAWDQLRAAGRQGSAVADELIEFAARPKWRRHVLEVAAEAADRSLADWEIYRKAFDEIAAIRRN